MKRKQLLLTGKIDQSSTNKSYGGTTVHVFDTLFDRCGNAVGQLQVNWWLVNVLSLF